MAPQFSTEGLGTTLLNGFDGDFDIYGKDATTCHVRVGPRFNRDVKELKERYKRSRTEVEMLLASAGASKCSQFMRESGLGWTKPMDILLDCIRYETPSFSLARQEMESLKGRGELLTEPFDDQEPDKIKVLKKTYRTLNEKQDAYGLSSSNRLSLGICLVVEDNPDLFNPNTMEFANNVVRKVRLVMEHIPEESARSAKQFGRYLSRADDSGDIRDEYRDDMMERVSESWPAAYSHISEGYNEYKRDEGGEE